MKKGSLLWMTLFLVPSVNLWCWMGDTSATAIRKADKESGLEESDEILAPYVTGIVIKTPREKTTTLPEGENFAAYGLNLSEGKERRLKKRLLRICKGHPLTTKLISRLKKEVILFYQSIHRPVVLVNIPEQEVTDGVLVIDIAEAVLEKVTVKGNKWFSEKRYKNAIRLREEEPINSNILAGDLEWLNRNPFRIVDAVFSAGEKPQHTDIELVVKDECPWRFYAGSDDTGFKETSYIRFFAGLVSGNLFNADQQFSYQFTTSPTPKQFMAHTVSWAIPLPWRHVIALYGGYSSLEAHVHSSMRSRGMAGQASLRYEIPFLPQMLLLDSVSFGADFKRTNNTVEFGGTEIINQSVNLFELAVAASLTRDKDNLRTYAKLQIFGQPGPILPDMSRELYEELRPHANNRFFYGTAQIHNLYRPPDTFAFENRIELQLSANNLLANDQYGLGGYNTVRGYAERAVNVDNALVISSNFYTPAITFIKSAHPDRLVGLVFLDYGLGFQHEDTFLDDKKYYNLVGIGPGVRYHWDHWLTVRLDWGVKLTRIEGDAPRTRFHFSVIGSY